MSEHTSGPPHTIPAVAGATCQTFVEAKAGRCGALPTFYVKGTLGNLWAGWHCDLHALDVARRMGHQGGCVLVPLNQDGGVLYVTA